jgi:molybdopterin/thiamine biosynthesis adenylyltransferase
MDLTYKALFERNYGIFTEKQQERVRSSTVLIIGDSGTGETLASLLARCGVEHFILAGQGIYTASDMNRQIGCFTDTIGENKIASMSQTILNINPSAQVSPYHELPAEDELEALIEQCDVVIPAVDDLSYSVLIFRAARRRGKPAVLCLPSGSIGWISVFTQDTDTIEDVFGVPKLNYKGLQRVVHSREYRCAQYNFITAGDWRVDWFWDYFLGKRPLALICTVEWMAVSLAGLEVIKILTGKWKPKLAPKCWYIRKGKVSSSHFGLFIKWHRKLGWIIFGEGIGIHLHKLTHWFWGTFFRLIRYRQKHRERRQP